MAGEQATTTRIDLAELAPRMIQASAAVATGRLRLVSPGETFRRLAEGDADVVAQFRRELAHQVSSTLIWMDPHVIAVYQDPATQPDRLDAPLRIIVHVKVETAALRNLIASIGEALREARVGGLPPLEHMSVEATIVDEHSLQVADRGYLVLQGHVEPLVAR